MNDFEKYLNYKLIQWLISNDKAMKLIDSYDDVILNENFIICMNIFCEVHIDNNHLDKIQLNKFFQLIYYINERMQLDKEYNDLINKMKISVNMSSGVNLVEYYAENYINRFLGHKFVKNLLDFSSLPQLIEKIKKSISLDYFVLTLLTIIPIDKFNATIDDVVLDEYFLLSVNQIISEFPDILDNDIFVDRLSLVVNRNVSQISDIKDKQLQKVILKESKYYAKNLKEE